MWTEPAYRRRGLGRRVLEAILAWARQQGVRRLTLHASVDGQPRYAQAGFTGTNEMRLELPAPPGEPAGELEPVRDSRRG
jgi:GNAT superfamily N-acetyltransferase